MSKENLNHETVNNNLISNEHNGYNSNNEDYENNQIKTFQEVIEYGYTLNQELQLSNLNNNDNKNKLEIRINYMNFEDEIMEKNTSKKILKKNHSNSRLHNKIHSKYNKFIELNKPKFRVYSDKKENIRNKGFKRNHELLTSEFDGILNSIKTNKILMV